MSFLPVEDHDLSSRTSPPLLPPDALKNLSHYELNGVRFTDNDLVEAIRDENESKMAAIIVSDSVNLHFKIADFNDGTLLHYSAFHGLLTICHLLLLANFDIDEFDKEQNTPLMLAISANKNDVVNYLIRAGASTSIKGTDGMTSLHMAAKCGNLDAIKYVLRSSNDISFINCQDDGGWTPLVWACEHGHVEVVSYLITNGADPNLRDVEYNEALHWAAFSGSSDALELLLNTGCDVNTINVQGETPLHIAAREDRTNCLIMLLARGADVSVTNKNNETPLDYVSIGGESYNILLLNLKLQSVIGSNTVKFKTILSNDITRGRESNPVQCVNTVDDEPEPKNFVYVTKNYISQDYLRVDKNITSIHSCSCADNCLTINCSCTKKSKKCWYDEEGRLSNDFNFEDASTIFECNDTCGCNAITCRNRLVQKGVTQRFQIFKTEQKGWGLKTLRFIPKGSFVCEYIGEILTDTEADAREDDSFLFALSNTDEESFCVDARRYGNISRFINHSCSPNLYPVKLFVEHQDLRFPRIALFAHKNISAEEELSFDYGQRFWLVKCKFCPCKCNVPECKYSKDRVDLLEDCRAVRAIDNS